MPPGISSRSGVVIASTVAAARLAADDSSLPLRSCDASDRVAATGPRLVEPRPEGSGGTARGAVLEGFLDELPEKGRVLLFLGVPEHAQREPLRRVLAGFEGSVVCPG